MDIVSPWNHRVYEKDGEKIDKYQDLKREIGKLWGIRQQEVVPLVVGALGTEKKKGWIHGLINWGLPLEWDFCRKQLHWEQQGS